MNSRSRLAAARGGALLALGALGVHQLRYLLAFGPDSGAALHREGHGYLAAALPVVVALAAAALAASLVAQALRRRGAADLPSVASRVLWYAGALLAVYSAQELVEGALAPAHPSGAEALVGNGGWVVLPLAFLIGLAAAVAERLHEGVAERVGSRLRRPARRRVGAPRATAVPAPPELSPLASAPLAFGLARRPPPPSPAT